MILQPAHCSQAEIDEFCALVRQGGEVEGGDLEARVKNARALVFLSVDRALVGVAGLKQPAAAYRDGVFAKAGVPKASAAYGLELGWVFVVPDHQGKRYSYVLSSAAMSQNQHMPAFATTRLENVAMQRTLERLGFRRIGESWQSERDKQTRLVLYITT